MNRRRERTHASARKDSAPPVGVAIPESVEGTSVLPSLAASPADVGWRDYVHAGEPESEDRLVCWRSRMVAELAPRTEDALSDGKRLLSGKTLPSVRASLLG